MRVARTVSLAMLVFASTGCAHQHHAEPTAFPDGVLVGRHSAGTVALGNAQAATQLVNIGSLGIYGSLRANFSEWTDAAIDLLAEKLTDSGMTVTPASPRKLSLAVTDARIGYTGGGWAWKCTVTLNVEGANGLKATFVGERASWKYQRVCDAGISEAVANVLRDGTVLAYLGY